MNGQTRAPIVGASMVGRYNGVNGVMLSEWDAESSIHQAFLANWAVYRCVTINANAIAKLPFRAGKDPDKPDLYNPNAPLAQLLGPARPTTKRRVTGPNIDTSPHQLFAHAIAQYQVTGRLGWEIEWSGKAQSSKVVALWPLIAQYLWPKPTPAVNGTTAPLLAPPPRYFSGFEYRSQPGAPKNLDWDQCFYHWRPSQHDWRQPESPLQSARMDIAGMIEQSIYDFAFLKNGAVPASLVVTQEFGSAADFQKFQAQWGYKYGGSANAGKTAFVEMDAEDGNVGQMVDVKILGSSMRDAQSDARYDAKVKAICQALGVPQSKLDASGRTYSNAGVEDETWEEDTIIPLAMELQAAINLRLAPLVGDEVGWFDLSGLKTQQGQSFWVSVSPLDSLEKGAVSLNEYRNLVGQSRLDDPAADKVRYLENPALPEHHQETDRLDLTVASASAAQEGDVQPEQPGSGVDDKDVAANKPAAPVEVKDETDLNTKPTKKAAKRAPKHVEKQKAVAAMRAPFVTKAQKQMREYFAQQGAAMAADIRAKAHRASAPSVSSDSKDALVASIAALHANVIPTFGAWQAAQIGKSDFNANTSQVKDWSTTRSAQVADWVSSTTESDLAALADDFEGDDEEWADEVASYFTSDSANSRADNFGLSEVGAASGFAMLAAAMQSDAVTGKYWTVGGAACPLCVSNMDDGIIGVDEEFSSGGTDGGDCHPGCGCSVVYVSANGNEYAAQNSVTRSTLASGIMVAFMVDPGAAGKLAVPGGEPAAMLHVTLAYLGRSTNNIDKDTLESTVRDYAATQAPLAGKVAGAGVFDLPQGWAVVGLVDAPGLDDLRHGLVAALEKSGIAVANEHSYTPHITIKYVDTLQDAAQVQVPTDIPLSWNKMTISWGAQSIDCPLSARRMISVGGERDYSPLLGALEADSLPKGNLAWPAPGREIADETVEAATKAWQAGFLALFDKQRTGTIDRLEGKRGRQMLKRASGSDPDISAIFKPEFWVQQTASSLEEIYANTTADMLRSVECEDLGESQTISDYLGSNSRDLSLLLAAGTYRLIQEAVARAVETGTDPVTQVSDVFDSLRDKTAPEIATRRVSALAKALETDLIGRAEREGREYRSVADVEDELLALAASTK